MQWLESYTMKRIYKLRREIIINRWKSIELGKTVEKISNKHLGA